MRKNGSFFQYRYFLHNKSSSNDKSLQIHKRRGHSERFFETVLDQEKNLDFYSLYRKEREKYYSFAKMIIYVIPRITLDIELYSITRCMMRQ